MLLTQAAVMLNVVGRNREVLRTPLLSGTTAKDNPPANFFPRILCTNFLSCSELRWRTRPSYVLTEDCQSTIASIQQELVPNALE